MRTVLLVNPRSGQGRGAKAAVTLASFLRENGVSVNVLHIGETTERIISGGGGTTTDGPARGGLNESHALIVMGGDGTLHHAADLVARTHTPVYHYPMGTENLFARAFGMKPDPAAVLAAIRAQDTCHIDLGTANGSTFVLMAGVGLDASIVHRVAKGRTKAIGHRSYLLPAIAELADPCLPTLTVRVDGDPIAEGRRGFVIIGNMREYGGRMDPCPDAKRDDGQLDVTFFPCRTRRGLIGWALDAKRGVHIKRRRIVTGRGEWITIESHSGTAPVQLDGEAPGIRKATDTGLPSSITPLEVRVRPAAMRVLAPEH